MQRVYKMMSSTVLMGVLASGWMGAQAVQAVSASTPVPPTPGKSSDPLLEGSELFAANAREANEINMDGKSLGLLGGSGGLGDAAKKLDFVVVHSYEYDRAGMYRQQDVDAVVNRLHDGSWSCMVHTRSAQESADICMRQSGDHETNELVVIAAEPKQVAFIHIKGRMSLADLQKLGASVGMGPARPVPPPTPPLVKR